MIALGQEGDSNDHFFACKSYIEFYKRNQNQLENDDPLFRNPVRSNISCSKLV
jgi:hypothetical protein